MIVNVEESPAFSRVVKKLHANQKADLKKAVKAIRENPTIGESKADDLSEVRVYKFKMVKQLTLLAYKFNDAADHFNQTPDHSQSVLKLIGLGSHENFYRDLKNRTP